MVPVPEQLLLTKVDEGKMIVRYDSLQLAHRCILLVLRLRHDRASDRTRSRWRASHV